MTIRINPCFLVITDTGLSIVCTRYKYLHLPAASTICMTDRRPTLLDCLSLCSITTVNTAWAL